MTGLPIAIKVLSLTTVHISSLTTVHISSLYMQTTPPTVVTPITLLALETVPPETLNVAGIVTVLVTWRELAGKSFMTSIRIFP